MQPGRAGRVKSMNGKFGDFANLDKVVEIPLG